MSLTTYLNHLNHIKDLLNHFENNYIYFFNTLLYCLKVQTTKIHNTNVLQDLEFVKLLIRVIGTKVSQRDNNLKSI